MFSLLHVLLKMTSQRIILCPWNKNGWLVINVVLFHSLGYKFNFGYTCSFKHTNLLPLFSIKRVELSYHISGYVKFKGSWLP